MERDRSRQELTEMLLTLHRQRDSARAVEAHALVLKLTDEIDAVRSAIATIDIFDRVAGLVGGAR